jgi:hypothetical protein
MLLTTHCVPILSAWVSNRRTKFISSNLPRLLPSLHSARETLLMMREALQVVVLLMVLEVAQTAAPKSPP